MFAHFVSAASRTGALVAVLASCSLGMLACGDDASSGGKPATGPLTSPERSAIDHSRRAVWKYCGRLRAYLANGKPLPASLKVQADQGVERLIELTRLKPAAEYQTGVALSTLLGDLAEDLEGSNCAPDLEREIDSALATIPPS
jgi:hypothetical protein